MTFIRSIGKQFKSKALQATEAEAGALLLAGVTLNILVIGLIAFL
jgi:hypothetical protein